MDINGGQLTQTNGNPAWPAAQSTGPLTAGNIPHGDGVVCACEYVGGSGLVELVTLRFVRYGAISLLRLVGPLLVLRVA